MIQIITTAFNTEKYIEYFLDSISNNYEILLGIDNCEKTLKKVKSIWDKYSNLKVFFSEKNVGTYILRNTLIKNSNASNLLFIDSDDAFINDGVEYLEKNHINKEIVVYPFQYMDQHNNIKNKSPLHVYAKGSFFCKNEIFKKLGGFKPVRHAADGELIDRIKRLNINIFLEKKYLLNYRRHSSSLTHTVPLTERRETHKKIYGGPVKITPTCCDGIWLK